MRVVVTRPAQRMRHFHFSTARICQSVQYLWLNGALVNCSSRSQDFGRLLDSTLSCCMKSQPQLDPQFAQLLQTLPPILAGAGWPAMTFHQFGAAAFHDVETTWAGHPERQLAWDWKDWYASFRMSPHRLEVAVRIDGTLIGLILGRLREPGDGSPVRVEWHYIERSPGDGPLQGEFVTLAIEIARAYALLSAAKELRLCHPIEPLHDYYVEAGFELVRPDRAPIYCRLAL
jgi:hypothetical protein